MGFWDDVQKRLDSLIRDDEFKPYVSAGNPELNDDGVLPEIKIQEATIFRCGNFNCGKLALQRGAYIPRGLRTGDDPNEVQYYLQNTMGNWEGKKWCLTCCQRLSR